MKKYLAASVAACGILAALAATARAETATLEIKRLSDSGSPFGVVGRTTDYLYRYTSSQSFNAMVGPVGKDRIAFGGMKEQDEAFKKIVNKEPKYESEYPFRGVAKLGTQQYLFVLDATPEKPKADEKKAAAEKTKPAADAEKKEAEKSAAAPAKKAETPKAIRYDRLYFDANRNGDLTDDKVVEAQAMPGIVISGGSYSNFSFPQVDLTVDADGTPVEYSFSMRGYVSAQPQYSYAGAQLSAAAYREGEITLDGKSHRVAIIDFNSNGRFDDRIEIMSNVRGSGGQVYPQQGDMLLIDPDPKSADYPYDPARSKFRNYVSNLVNIDGRYYDVKITPAGDKIDLEPSTVPLGKISNPNGGYSAVIYGDRGFLKISGDKDQPASVPAGEWKLLSYSIDLTPPPEPAKAAEEKAKTADSGAKKTATANALSAAVRNLLGGTTATAAVANRRTVVSAGASADYKSVRVVADETVEMPFGPPFKPVVTSYNIMDEKGKQATQLSMSLVGSAGENCTDMMVNGARPAKPEFTITDPDGKVVETGSFEYG